MQDKKNSQHKAHTLVVKSHLRKNAPTGAQKDEYV